MMLSSRCWQGCEPRRSGWLRWQGSDHWSVSYLRSNWALPPAAGGHIVRSLKLLQIAAEAELLRVRALLARQGRRAAFAIIALAFSLIVLLLAEAAGWQTLRLYVAPIAATLILL